MAKQTFTTGQVLTSAEMTSLQQTAMGGGSTTAKTVSYVLVAADAGTVVQMNSATATTITLNTALFAAGDSVQIQNIGAGVCTVTAGTATVTTAGSLALSQWEGGQLYFTATSSAIFFDIVQSSGMTNPLTTTGDTIYSSSGTTAARLGIGSTNQALGVTGGIPAWQASSKSTLATTGDTLYASAANTPAALAIGSTGQVLTIAAGLPSWATAAAGGATLLSTTTLSGATTTISSISQSYKNLYIFIYNVSISAVGQLRLSLNTSENARIAGAYGSTASQAFFADDTNYITGTQLGATSPQNGFIYQIGNYADTLYHPLSIVGGYINGATWTGLTFGGVTQSTTAISSIKLLMSGAGTFSAGTVKIYGVN